MENIGHVLFVRKLSTRGTLLHIVYQALVCKSKCCRSLSSVCPHIRGLSGHEVYEITKSIEWLPFQSEALPWRGTISARQNTMENADHILFVRVLVACKNPDDRSCFTLLLAMTSVTCHSQRLRVLASGHVIERISAREMPQNVESPSLPERNCFGEGQSRGGKPQWKTLTASSLFVHLQPAKGPASDRLSHYCWQ